MVESKNKEVKEDVVIKNLADELSENDVLTVVSLMKNGRLKDEKLMRTLGAKSANSAGYYRKKLERKGIIKGYTAEIDWGKLGYKTEFFVIAEGNGISTILDVEKNYLFSTVEYMNRVGDVIIIPTGLGKVVISDIYSCFGEKNIALMHGYATSDQDALIYSKAYIPERYSKAKTTLISVRYSPVSNFFIQKEVVAALKETFTMTKKDKSALEQFIKKFPWDKLGVKI